MDNEREEAIQRLAREHNVSPEYVRNVIGPASGGMFRGEQVSTRSNRTMRTEPVVTSTSEPAVFEATSFAEFLTAQPLGRSNNNMKSLEKELKKRHLSHDERHHYHAPKSDWCESSKGDICKSASTIDVSDLVIKVT